MLPKRSRKRPVANVRPRSCLNGSGTWRMLGHDYDYGLCGIVLMSGPPTAAVEGRASESETRNTPNGTIRGTHTYTCSHAATCAHACTLT
eukprot:scaffold1309_cov117-Isochrysis_galbana.AAC.23